MDFDYTYQLKQTWPSPTDDIWSHSCFKLQLNNKPNPKGPKPNKICAKKSDLPHVLLIKNYIKWVSIS